MLWAIFPVLAQLFYTSGSYVQNYLADFAAPKKRAGALIIMRFPCFLAILLILVAIMGRTVFILPLPNAIGLVVAGAINVFGSMYYYRALQEGDTADVAIIGQLAPLVTLGLGVAILGETISANQGIGLLLIMAAAFLIVFGGSNKRQRSKPNLKIAMYTILAMFFSNLSDVVYALSVKGFTADLTLLGRGLFFFNLGSLVTVIIMFICMHSWRRALKTALVTSKKHPRNVFMVVCDNAAFLIGDLIYKYGLLIVSVIAMMTAISKVSGLFISIFITVLLGRVFPRFIHGKRITKKILFQYIIAAVLIVAGIVVMN